MGCNDGHGQESQEVSSLVPQGGLVCEECPLGLNAFLIVAWPVGQFFSTQKSIQTEGTLFTHETPCGTRLRGAIKKCARLLPVTVHNIEDDKCS